MLPLVVGSVLAAFVLGIFATRRSNGGNRPEPEKELLFGSEFKQLTIDFDGFTFLHAIWIRLMHPEEKDLFLACLEHLDAVLFIETHLKPGQDDAFADVDTAFSEAVTMRSRFKALADLVYLNDASSYKKAVILENAASIYDLVKVSLSHISAHAQEVLRERLLMR